MKTAAILFHSPHIFAPAVCGGRNFTCVILTLPDSEIYTTEYVFNMPKLAQICDIYYTSVTVKFYLIESRVFKDTSAGAPLATFTDSGEFDHKIYHCRRQDVALEMERN